MSKPTKELLQRELAKRFEGITSLAVVGFTGLNATATNEIRQQLTDKGISLTVVKNSLARQAFKAIGLDVAADLLEGPCAIAVGGDSVVDIVRQLIDLAKQWPELTVKSAVLEGDAFASDRVFELSKYPTRDEALARIVTCITTPGAKLAGALVGPGSTLASLVKAIEEKADNGKN